MSLKLHFSVFLLPQKTSAYFQPLLYAMRPESYRIRWNNTNLGLLRRSRSFKVTEFGTNRNPICDFLLVINTNLPPVLHRFRDIAFDRTKIAILAIPLVFNPPPPLSPTEGFPWDNLRKILPECQWIAKVPNSIQTLPKISTGWVGRTNVTDIKTTDRRIYDDIANVTWVHVRW